MFKKLGPVWMVVLIATFLQMPTGPKRFIPQNSAVNPDTEARMEQQKSKWAPNGMKVLIIHGKRRWVHQRFLPQLEKSETVPILKEGV